MSRTKIWTVLWFGACLYACDDVSSTDGDVLPDASAPECVGDDECGMAEQCVEGACVPSGMRPCGDRLCVAGESCVDGVCQANCTTDAECPEGELCTDGLCEVLEFSCGADGDCMPTERCVEGVCERVPDACMSDQGCPAGQVCVDDQCIVGVRCATGDDCADGEVCERRLCVPAPDECQEDAECTLGLVCVDGGCVLPEVSCATDGDCGDGQICRDQQCQPGSAECASDRDCFPGHHCDAAMGRCLVNAPGSCVEPTEIERYGVFRGTLMGTPGAIDSASCGRGGRGPESVFALQLPIDTTVCLTTSGTPYDTVLSVRAECDDPGTEIMDGCNDDSDYTGGSASALTLFVEADQRLFVILDAFTDAEGTFALTVTPGVCGATGPPPECVNERDCAPSHACIADACVALCDEGLPCEAGLVCNNGLCELPILPPGTACTDDYRVDLDGFGRYEGTTVGGARDGSSSCGEASGAPEIAHQVRFDREGTVCATTQGTDFDTILYIRTDCDDAGSELACDDDIAFPSERASEVEFRGRVGETYYVYVDGYDNNGDPAQGDYVLTLFPGECGTPLCGVDAECEAGEICQAGRCTEAPIPCQVDAECPDERVCDVARGICGGRPSTAGTCGMPTHIDDFGEYRDRTDGANAELFEAGCGGVGGAEAVFRYRMDYDGPVCFDTEGSAFDTTLYVRTVCRDVASELACSDDVDFRNADFSAVTVDVVAGMTYFVIVDGFGGAEGDFVLNATQGPCVLDDAGCVDNADCLGRVCVEGACVDCALDEHCPGSWVCEGLGCVPAPCSEDGDCVAGEICEGERCLPGRRTPDACLPENLFLFPELGSREGNTEEMSAMTGASCGEASLSPEAAYRVAFEANETVCATVTSDVFDPIVSVRSACDDPATEITCSDNVIAGVEDDAAVTIDARAGVPYYILVDGADRAEEPSAGAYTLSLTSGACVQCRLDADCGDDRVCVDGRCTVDAACDADDDCPGDLVCNAGECGRPPAVCEADFECPGQLVCQDGLCTALGACAEPTPLQIGAAVRGSTGGENDAHHYAGTCGGRAGLRLSPEDVYTFVGRDAGRVCLSTANRVGGTDYDTVMYVRRDDCAAGAELVCNDDENFELGDPGNSQSTIEIAVEEGVRYFVFIDGYGRNSAGDYMLTSSYGSCDALPPPQCEADADCGLGQECSALQQCVYQVGTCPEPVAIEAFGRYESDTGLAWARHNGTCTFASGPEGVFVLERPVETCVEVDTAESAFDTVLHVRRGDCEEQGAEVACNDDVADDSERARLRFVVEPGVPHYIIADAYRRGGRLVLDIAEVPCDAL